MCFSFAHAFFVTQPSAPAPAPHSAPSILRPCRCSRIPCGTWCLRGQGSAAGLAACTSGKSESTSTAASGNAGIYTPGTYTATETGTGTVTVTMTFSDSAITEVKVDTSKETIALAVDSAADFQEALMAAQSSEIDSVSGATITSKAVKKAAASCIEQAMGLATTEETTETVDDGTPKWLGTAPVIADSNIVDTFETEVLVVGGGTGGLFAACSAAENGAKNTGYILCTMDGIQIDQNMNAVDTNNDPIPGLYVVDNDSGGYFSGTYPNLSTGAACGRTVTFGRRAGRIAATEGI